MSPKAKKRNLRNSLTVGVCLAPSLIVILVFTYIAFVFCVYMSLHSWDMISPMKWIGLDNYHRAFQSSEFWNSLKVTLIYVVVTVPLGVIIGLAFGLLLHRVTPAKGLYRLLIFLPVIISMVVAATVWKFLFDPNIGFINHVLFSLGVSPSHWTQWLKDPNGGALLALFIVGIWKRVGYNAILFLGGLQNISETYYEAALIDGANGWQRFTKITLPLLSPITFIVTVTTAFSAFKVVESVMVMTGGGPAKSTEVLVLHIYNNAFSYLRMGYAAALSVILFLVILLFTIVQQILEKRMVFYQ